MISREAEEACRQELGENADWIPGRERPVPYGFHVQKAIDAAREDLARQLAEALASRDFWLEQITDFRQGAEKFLIEPPRDEETPRQILRRIMQRSEQRMELLQDRNEELTLQLNLALAAEVNSFRPTGKAKGGLPARNACPQCRPVFTGALAPALPLVMTFKVDAAGKTIEGQMNIPDDDGSTHLPMMIHGLMKQLAESMPEILRARTMTITASLAAPNASVELNS